MKIFMRTFFICMLVVLCYSESMANAQSIAKVISVTEGATIERNGKSQALVLKDDVFINDVISTTATGKAQIIFNDDTIVAIGVNSKFYMSDYSDDNRKAFRANVAEGFARFVTGAIVEANPNAFTVRTPEATARIRGTILSIMRLNSGQTMAFVEGSSLDTGPSVVVNGVTIAPGNMATFGLNGQVIAQPISMNPQQRQMLKDQSFVSLGISSGQSAQLALEQAGIELVAREDDPAININELNNSANNANQDRLFSSQQDNLINTLQDDPFVGTKLDIVVSGTFDFDDLQTASTDKSTGVFSFEANLRNNQIFNARVNTTAANVGNFQVISGTGTINPTGFVIDGGDAKVQGSPVISWSMTGNQTINTGTKNVNGTIEVDYRGGHGGSEFKGDFQGTVK